MTPDLPDEPLALGKLKQPSAFYACSWRPDHRDIQESPVGLGPNPFLKLLRDFVKSKFGVETCTLGELQGSESQATRPGPPGPGSSVPVLFHLRTPRDWTSRDEAKQRAVACNMFCKRIHAKIHAWVLSPQKTWELPATSSR